MKTVSTSKLWLVMLGLSFVEAQASETGKFNVSKTAPLVQLQLFSIGSDTSGGSGDLIKEKKSQFRIGDKAVICLKAREAGFAKVWDIKPDKERIEIAPNFATESLDFVTAGNRSIRLQANQQVCMGTPDQNFAFQISENELGAHRLWVQWSPNETDLFSSSDYPVFSKSLGTRDVLTDQERSTLQKMSEKGVVEYRYNVTE